MIIEGYQPEGESLDRTNPPRQETVEEVILAKMAEMEKLTKKHPGISVRAFIETAPGEYTELRTK